MTYKDLSNFTYKELRFFTYADISLDKYELIAKAENQSIDPVSYTHLTLPTTR